MQTPGLGVCVQSLPNRSTHCITESGEVIGTAKGPRSTSVHHFQTSLKRSVKSKQACHIHGSFAGVIW